MNKWQIVTSLVVALVAVLSLSVAAFAQGNQPPAVTPQQGYGRGMMGQGMFGAQTGQPAQAPMGYGFHFGVNGGSLVDVTAKVTGLEVQDVVAELQAGKTFADVANAHGKTATDLVNAFLANRKATLDKAVADGRFTQDAADTLLATMKTNVEQHVNSAWQSPTLRSGDFQPRGMGRRFTDHSSQFLGPLGNR